MTTTKQNKTKQQQQQQQQQRSASLHNTGGEITNQNLVECTVQKYTALSFT